MEAGEWADAGGVSGSPDPLLLGFLLGEVSLWGH